MRSWAFLTSLCLSASATPCQGLGVSSGGIPVDTPFVAYVRIASTRLQLTDLRTRPPGTLRELRIWDGFGIGGVRLTIVQETKSGWRAFTAYPVDTDTRARLTRVKEKVDWEGRWRAAEQTGLKELPPYPSREPSNLMVADGHSAVLEWFDGTRYGISGANNPDAFCSADDRRIINVLVALRAWQDASACPPER